MELKSATIGYTHTSCQQRYFKCYESVLFDHSRRRPLHWQRSGGPRPYCSERGEEHCADSQECRAQRCEGHKKSRAHCSQYLNAIGKVILYGSSKSPSVLVGVDQVASFVVNADHSIV